ncbi:hypothetical protein ACFVMC_28425 [Nocardia sp. NPDC127579]|uniref:hypothetical protein n=1 Tax=Nocardia sp. NPDC127579 TaxID=3345402 RepID=UPI003644E253
MLNHLTDGLPIGLAKSAARAAARTAARATVAAYNASLEADAARNRQQAEQDRFDELERRQAEQFDAERAHAQAQAEHNRQMLEIQQRNAWMTYRQTADGRAFQEWCDRVLPLVETLERRNSEWLTAFEEIVRQSISRAEWAAEEGDLEHTWQSDGVTYGYLTFLPSDHELRSGWRRTLIEPGKRKAVLLEVREHLHRQRVEYFGCDPVIEPGARPPGWAVDDANWQLAAMIRAFIETAYTTYPAPSEFPELAELPPFVALNEVKPPQLAQVIRGWINPDGNSDYLTTAG